ncbi:MAG: hypothetical protein RLY14_2702 [Planctomycetota bacterium]
MRRVIWFWIVVALVSGVIGYLSLSTAPTTSRITFSNYPQIPADQSLVVDLWSDRLPFIIAREGIVLVTEGKPEDGPQTRFFCPRKPNEDGSVIIRFPLENKKSLKSIFLSLQVVAFYAFDESAELDIELKSAATSGRFLKFAELGARTQENVIRESFDITEYARGSTEVDVKITARATKLLYHPTPDDPIGYAGAQALRQQQIEKWAARLDVWFEK